MTPLAIVGTVLGFSIGFLLGTYVMKNENDKYWVRRIRQGEIPTPENMKTWNPLNEDLSEE